MNLTLQIRQFRRRITAFRLFLFLLFGILVYHYFFKKPSTSTRQSPVQEKYHPALTTKKVKLSAPEIDKIPENAKSLRVIEAFKDCWKGYKASAWGYDEFHPLSKTGSNWFSLGLTIVDGLDTAYLMGQKDIFKEARDWVEKELKFDYQEGESNVFEITIRVLGGLMSSFHFTNDKMFLEKAVDLADRLLIAFETKSHIPLASINFKKKKAIPALHGSGSSTSEATTLQMEFKYLTYLTNDSKYWNAAQKVMKTVFDLEAEHGLLPVFIDPTTGKFEGGDIRLGSRGDSYYGKNTILLLIRVEYLEKQWLLTNQTEVKYHQEFRKSMTGVREKLLGISHPNELLFVGESNTQFSYLSPKMDHLVCFLPGTLAWGATKGHAVDQYSRIKLDPESRRDLELAEELARSCFEMYAQTETKLSPEIVFWKTIPSEPYNGPPIPEKLFKYHTSPTAGAVFYPHWKSVPENGESDMDTRFHGKFTERTNEMDFSIHPNDGHNLMRPETVESLFILYRITGKEKYREWGWKIFEAFEKYSKIENGYTSLVKDSRCYANPLLG